MSRDIKMVENQVAVLDHEVVEIITGQEAAWQYKPVNRDGWMNLGHGRQQAELDRRCSS